MRTYNNELIPTTKQSTHSQLINNLCTTRFNKYNQCIISNGSVTPQVYQKAQNKNKRKFDASPLALKSSKQSKNICPLEFSIMKI